MTFFANFQHNCLGCVPFLKITWKFDFNGFVSWNESGQIGGSCIVAEISFFLSVKWCACPICLSNDFSDSWRSDG